MKILIGLHDSAAAKEALDYVRMQRWPPGSKALLLAAHEATQQSYSWSYYGQARESVKEVFDHDAGPTRDFIANAEHMLRNGGLETETRVLQGNPREALVDVAIDEDVDLIVVGSRDRSAVSRVIEGSVAAHLATHAPCNVLVVKHAHGDH